MAILSIQTTQTGLVGTVPSFVYIETNDTYAEVITPGYLTQYAAQMGPTNAAVVTTSDEGVTLLKVVNSSSGLSLQAFATSGVVVDLPTTIDHLATYANTDGALSQDATTAINAGNLQAGLSGTAGAFVSYPPTAAKGFLTLKASNNTNDYNTIITNATQGQASTYTVPDAGVSSSSFLLTDNASSQTIATGDLILGAGSLTLGNGNVTLSVGNLSLVEGEATIGSNGHVGFLNIYPAAVNSGVLTLQATNSSGNFTTTITNASLGQSTTFSLPDPANALARVLVGATATPFTSGHLLQSSGTGGLVTDSGITTANVQLKANIKAATTGNIGGAGAGPLSITLAGVTSSSVVIPTVKSSSNPCYVASHTAGTGSFTVTMSADPGATLIIDYVVFIAAQ